MAAKYTLVQTQNGGYRFNLKAGNGEIILTSESYAGESGARNGIESVRKNSPLDERYERKTSALGHLSFVLKAGNGEPIGSSEVYSSASSMENGIESVKKNGPVAEISEAD